MTASTHFLAQEIEESERNRLLSLNSYEERARSEGFRFIAGVDEAGRGPLAGPVSAAVCMIPSGIYIPRINDSKLLSEKLRLELFNQITSDERILFHISLVDAAEIDRINIYQATIQAMFTAVSKLKSSPDYLLVDGLKLPHPSIPCLKIIKGDRLSQSIAAASVLAKVTRDRLMAEYHERWPEYGFDKHKGYGTPAHIAAIERYGPCECHRRSFEPVKSFILRTSAN
jgi:ribonuclease HII